MSIFLFIQLFVKRNSYDKNAHQNIISQMTGNKRGKMNFKKKMLRPAGGHQYVVKYGGAHISGQ